MISSMKFGVIFCLFQDGSEWWYCWWKESCTTCYLLHPRKNGIFSISTDLPDSFHQLWAAASGLAAATVTVAIWFREFRCLPSITLAVGFLRVVAPPASEVGNIFHVSIFFMDVPEILKERPFLGGVVENKGDSVTCFHGEHQSNYPLATVKFPCHFFLKARVERNRQLALARRSSVIPEKNPRRWEWFFV